MIIIICGLNGSGKSTLGKILAERLGFHFIDNEDLFFPKKDPNYLFASPRSKDEVCKLLSEEIKSHKDFVFASVKGNYGSDIQKHFTYAILMEVPKEIRMQRIKARSFEKFGDRMLEGGDLYEKENAFFDMVETRDESLVTDWLNTLNCPVVRINGTRPIHENVEWIVRQLQK